jgi:release factor glutamine methyltransferase
MTKISQIGAIQQLAATLARYHYPASYLSELTTFLGISNTNAELLAKQQSSLSFVQTLLRKDCPVEYIVHRSLFCEQYFYVTKDVLIPRFDTEALVYWGVTVATAVLAKNKEAKLSFLDIGTGSGAIIIALANELAENDMRQECGLYATDISDKAITIAQRNADSLSQNKIRFINAMLPDATAQEEIDQSTDLIILTNPPYIAASHYPTLPLSVRAFEPELALKEQPDFLEKLQAYISQLEQKGMRVHIGIEYNNNEGTMIQRFSDGTTPVDLKALLLS